MYAHTHLFRQNRLLYKFETPDASPRPEFETTPEPLLEDADVVSNDPDKAASDTRAETLKRTFGTIMSLLRQLDRKNAGVAFDQVVDPSAGAVITAENEDVVIGALGQASSSSEVIEEDTSLGSDNGEGNTLRTLLDQEYVRQEALDVLRRQDARERNAEDAKWQSLIDAFAETQPEGVEANKETSSAEVPENESMMEFNARVEKLTVLMVEQAGVYTDRSWENTLKVLGALQTDYEQRFGVSLDAEYSVGSNEFDVQQQLRARMETLLGLAYETRENRRLANAAEEQYEQAFRTLDNLEAGARTNIEDTKERLRNRSAEQMILDKMLGTTDVMSAALNEDAMQLVEIQQARNNLIEASAMLGPRSSVDPRVRLENIAIIMKPVYELDYSEVSRLTEQVEATSAMVDKSIRTVAKLAPGGQLGTALADYRMYPDDPESKRKLCVAIAMTSLDVIPLPGAKRGAEIGKAFGGKLAAKITPKDKVVRAGTWLGEKAGKWLAEKPTKVVSKKIVDTGARVAIPDRSVENVPRIEPENGMEYAF